ncbi:hypothetical protein [Kribbella catacumbae]|uniref:hypothetical protein n=1 Tax=Kribbella catacumbae TaxID=460086 RepID=UPI00037FC501|nr:hypothetical protein [Kribbella catacumbae]
MRRWAIFSGLVLVLFGCGVATADAHVIASTGYSTVTQDGQRVNYLLSLEYAVLARAVDLGAPVDDDARREEALEAAGPRLTEYLDERLVVSLDGAACEPGLAGTSIASRAGKPYAELALTFSCPGSTGSLHLLYKVFQDADAVADDHTNLVAQLQTRSNDVQVVENTGSKAVVRVTGTSAEHPGLKLVTTYTATADDQFITASTTFTNDSAAALPVWAGDALDHDGAGSRSAVSGFPVITSGGPFSQVPNAKRWIGQAGTGPDNQTYGLIYSTDSGAFTGYSQSNFTMSKFKLDLPAGGSHTITRKIVVASNGGAADKFAVLNQMAAQ